MTKGKRRGDGTNRSRDSRHRDEKGLAHTRPRPVVINGWTLLFWGDFRDRWIALREAAQDVRRRDPKNYMHTPGVKLFRTVRDLVFEEIPAEPDHRQFRQGGTLGPGHTHWRQAKFHRRFRLFFRFHSASRTIIYAWLNDENTLRKAGAHSDPYVVFRRMLERGAPPTDWESLMRATEAVPFDDSDAPDARHDEA